MSIQEAVLYRLLCDRCGKQYEYDEQHIVFDTPAQAEDAVAGTNYDVDEEWHSEGGNHVCWDCIPHGPDWDEEHEACYEGKAELVCKWCNVRAEEATHV